MTGLAIVIVTYDAGDALSEVLDALEAQKRAGDEIIVVDNGSKDGTLGIVRRHPAVDRLVEPGVNLGFAAGVNLGAAESRAPLLCTLNPDAVPQPGCLDALREGPAEWAAWQGVVCLADGAHVNSAGNHVHFLGLSWAGRLGEPVEALGSDPAEAAALSGACLVVRREAWDGFPPEFFMYCEDLDLSLRLRLYGERIGVLPTARVVHDYDFHKGARKWEQLERNRWLCVLRCWPGRLLVPTLPLLVACELPLLALAMRQGWARAKVHAIGGVLRALPRVLAERRTIQARRTVPVSTFAAQLRSDLDSPYLGAVGRSRLVSRLLAVAWWAVRHVAGVR